jgi:cellulose biosynthesis protein BcsQ
MKKGPGFYDLIVRDAAWKDVLKTVAPERFAQPYMSRADVKGQLFIVPGNDETRGIPAQVSDGFVLLKKILQLNNAKVDYVLIDTMPTPSLIHSLVYAATHEYCYVTICEQWALDGLAESIFRLREFNPLRVSKGLPEVKILGIQVTQYKPRTIEHSESLKDIEDAMPGMVLPPLNDRVAWAEAARQRVSIFNAAPESDAALEAWGLIDIVEGTVANGK